MREVQRPKWKQGTQLEEHFSRVLNHYLLQQLVLFLRVEFSRTKKLSAFPKYAFKNENEFFLNLQTLFKQNL